MSKIPFEYFVDLVNGQWAVNLNGRYTGPYPSREEAINAAIESATDACHSDSRGAEIMIRGEDGRFLAVWRHARDGRRKR